MKTVAALALLAVPALATAAGAAVQPLDARHSPYIDGNASPHLPAGPQGKVVLVGISRGLAVLRNNTGAPVENIHIVLNAVTGTGKTRRLAGTTPGRATARPFHVAPGELAFVQVDLTCGTLAGTKYDRCRVRWPAHTRFVLGRATTVMGTGQDLAVSVAPVENGSATVTATAPPDVSTDSLDYRALLFCFAANGAPRSTRVLTGGKWTVDTVAKPGDQTSLTIHGDATCPVFLVAYTGLPAGSA